MNNKTCTINNKTCTITNKNTVIQMGQNITFNEKEKPQRSV